MDIPALSINMAQAKLSQSAHIGVLKKVMDQMEQTGEQIVELMQASEAIPQTGIDIKA